MRSVADFGIRQGTSQRWRDKRVTKPAIAMKRKLRMVLARLLGRAPAHPDPGPLYIALVEQARLPSFYGQGKAPDTLDGRFDMICVHAFLVLHRLKGEGPVQAAFSQALFDTMFQDMDRGLREMGVGDMGVGVRVKHMARALFGRIEAYEQGLAGSDAVLTAALGRNLYGTVTPDESEVARVASYVRRAAAELAGQDFASLAAGKVSFPAL
jgi:cytochrome b pre-mRNA-processing protein 3